MCRLLFLVFFFFSSRRRHTRSLCYWSSDVCSSDLGTANDPIRYRYRVLDVASQPTLVPGTTVTGSLDPDTESDLYNFTGTAGQRVFFDNLSLSQAARSEERSCRERA